MLHPGAPIAPRLSTLGRFLLVVAAFGLSITLAIAAAITAARLEIGPIAGTEGSATPTARHDATEATIVLGGAQTLDPARAGDAGSSGIIAQLFDGLTTVDSQLVVRPALAASWELRDGGRTVVFRLRDGLVFSDGTPLTADDVVASWMRVLDPAAPSPLVSLLDDVLGASDYARGRGAAGSVGLHAAGQELTVRLTRPASDFPAIVASPTLAILPPGARADPSGLRPGAGFVVSGGYTLDAVSADTLELRANPRYWAGAPAITRVHVRTSLGGRSPVQAFQAGEVDLTSIQAFDARWIAYDSDLGPSLRRGVSLTVEYFGFDVRHAPFDDARVRRAFGEGVDWRRIVNLGSDGSQEVATGMIPPAISGRSRTDFLPPFDPANAQSLLAAARYPGGHGFPDVTLVTTGTGYEEAIAAQLSANLGITVRTETMEFGEYFARLGADPPAFWAVDWVADYPSRNAILRLLLASNQLNNFGHWSSAAFDTALADAGAASDSVTANVAYDRAEAIVRDDVPVVPLAYGTSWWLAAPGLLGAAENGLGFIRLAGLAWGAAR